MLRRIAPSLILLAAVMAGWPVATVSANNTSRRFIAAGPDDIPSPSAFRAGLAEFEKLPFDGAVIRPTRRLADGTEVAADHAFSGDPWQPTEIDPMVADLKEAKPGRARENFLAIQAAPGNVDWFDDTGWRETVDHWRLLARSAKLGGLRGLAFDPVAPDAVREDAPAPLFHFPSQTKRNEQDFAAYAKMARERGREVMLAVATEFPEAVVLCAGLYSELMPLVAGDAHPAPLLPSHPLGLLPAFIDGWWDAATPKLQIIDGGRFRGQSVAGNESDYNRLFTALRTQAPRLAAPEHRAKLRAQLILGQSVELDRFLGAAAGASNGDGTPAGAQALRLQTQAAAALRASDGWLLVRGGPAGRWWPSQDPAAVVSWNDALPGAATALSRARTPAAAARERLATASPAENRLANGDFAREAKNGLPESWGTWQNGTGTPQRQPPVPDANQPATALWSGPAIDAYFDQSIAVKPGETMVLGSRLKVSGQGVGLIKVGWKDAKGEWTAPHATVLVPPEGAPDSDGWHDLAAIVRVPTGASQLVLMLGAQSLMTGDDRVTFARAMVVRL